MTYPSVKETFYFAPRERERESERSVILTVPHGADAGEFLAFFPEIRADPELDKLWPVFESYLAIERDAGATELAHALAHTLSRSHGIRAHVVELNYPRGILDGGRLKGHALRHCLPPALMRELEAPLLQIHDATLSFMDRLYETLPSPLERRCLLVDVHTMASFCPVDESGRRFTFPVSFPRLEAYVNQYMEAENHIYPRKIDLITEDETGRLLADPILLRELKKALAEAAYPSLENEPYHAAPIYLSHQHMQKLPSISIDVPKHLVASSGEKSYELDRIEIHPESVERLSKVLARAIASSFHS